VYHESDLLICLALDSGVFDGLNPVEMAMMATLFTYEDRQSRNSPKGRSWQADHSSMILIKERIGVLASLAERLALAETAAGLPVTRAPDGGFASLVSRWATGHQLGRVLKDSGIPAGDFVRNVKQVIDLLGQIACVAEHDKTRQASQSAIGLLRRGVVADESRYGGMVMNGM